MRLADLVDVSTRVGATRSRTEKVGRLAALLRGATPEELVVAVPYLSGDLRQGRIGVGGAALRNTLGSAAEVPTLSLLEVDATFGAMAAMAGAGSASRRMEA